MIIFRSGEVSIPQENGSFSAFQCTDRLEKVRDFEITFKSEFECKEYENMLEMLDSVLPAGRVPKKG